jgi:hypothetical protein
MRLKIIFLFIVKLLLQTLQRYFDSYYLWHFSLSMNLKDSNLSSNKNFYKWKVIRRKRIIRINWSTFSDFSKDCNIEYIISNWYHRSRKYYVENLFIQHLKYVIANEKLNIFWTVFLVLSWYLVMNWIRMKY